MRWDVGTRLRTMNIFRCECLKNANQTLDTEDRLRFREASQAHRTAADDVLNLLEVAASTEPAHGVDDWIELGKKKGAKVILLKKESLWPALS